MLDVNMEPNIATFLFEADIEKYLRMTDTIEAIFEALPLSILQYINNEMNNVILCEKMNQVYLEGCTANAWGGWLNLLTFVSSTMTVFFYCINLIKYLFEEDTLMLWMQHNKLNALKSHGQ